MQAQVPRPPFMGLWTRIESFDRKDLHKALHAKKVVRATAMRGTIHLLSARDYVVWRPVLQEMLVKGADAIATRSVESIDKPALYKTGREFFGKAPAPFEDFRAHLETMHAAEHVRAMAYTVRMGVPLVMVPSDAQWAFPANAGFYLADSWLGTTVSEESDALDALVLRYLAAFGPATPADFQTWSGIHGARVVFERLRSKVLTFRDERKRELFDLPKAPRPDADSPAPVRFLPEYDNALLAHDDRTRIIAAEHRPRVFLKNLIVVGTFLVDGFVAGTWKLESKTKLATLTLNPFGRLAKRDSAAVKGEAEALLAFLEPDAAKRTVAVTTR
jgi:hypothetical protein